MRCPGQDRAYWKEDAVFEVPCPKCDAAVEFFKDESSGRCRSCGHRFRNPRISFDCAEWCAYAEECLGFVPQRNAPTDPGEGALVSRLIRAIKEEFGVDQARIAHALMVFQHARELLSKEGGDPRIVLAAALLLETERDKPDGTSEPAGQSIGKAAGLVKARQIMEGIGLDEDTIECVCHLIGSYRTGRDVDTMEFKIVSDADTLVKLAAESPHDDLDKLKHIVENRLKTKMGKAKARSLFSTL